MHSYGKKIIRLFPFEHERKKKAKNTQTLTRRFAASLALHFHRIRTENSIASRARTQLQ